MVESQQPAAFFFQGSTVDDAVFTPFTVTHPQGPAAASVGVSSQVPVSPPPPPQRN